MFEVMCQFLVTYQFLPPLILLILFSEFEKEEETRREEGV